MGTQVADSGGIYIIFFFFSVSVQTQIMQIASFESHHFLLCMYELNVER